MEKRVATAQSKLRSLAKNSPLVDVVGEECYQELFAHENLHPLAPRPANEQRINTISTVGNSAVLSAAAPTAVGVEQHLAGSGVSSPQKRSFVDLTDE